MVASHISVVNCCVIRRGYTACQRGQGYSAALSLVTCRTPSSGIQHTKMLALNLFHDNNSIIESQKVNLNHSTVFHYFKSKPLKLGFAWKIKFKLIFCSL